MIKPFGTRVLIKPVKVSGPLQSDSLCEYGEVLAIGEDVKKIKIGDTIAFISFGVEHFEMDGEKHYFVNEGNEFVLAKVTLKDESDK